MKVLFLTRSLEVGGAERQLVALARGLRQLGHDVVVLVFYARGPFTTDLVASDVRVVALDKRSRWDVVCFLYRLLRQLRNERADVVYSFLTMPNIVAGVLRPLLTGRLAWGIRSTRMDLSQYDRLVRVTERLKRYLAGQADLIVCNSQAGRDDVLADGFPARLVRVIENGIDTERFRPDAAARARLRKELGVEGGFLLVGMLARIDPMKGHETLIRAAAILVKRRPRTRVIAFGNGSSVLRAELHQLIGSFGLDGSMRLEAGRDDVPAVINAFDVLCSPSYGEGFPNVIGEAMACGVPCVVTDVGDSRAIVDGLGRVVPPRDPEALAEAIEQLLAEDREPLSRAVRQRIVDRFSVERMIRTTERELIACCSTTSESRRVARRSRK